MSDLFVRTLYYAIGVLITLSLLLITGIVFWRKHDTTREGLNAWIQCELTNAFTPDIYGLDVDCNAMRDPQTTVSPFWFMSWVIACVFAIIAQIILSFHVGARDRAAAVLSKQRTITKLMSSSRVSKGATNSSNIKHESGDRQASMESVEEDEVQLTDIGATHSKANHVTQVTSSNDLQVHDHEDDVVLNA
eukprot:CAMPEP_0202732824 /NCGR_PEP_ID=MMETSP1385-20130828/187857_1 /ASSEMBLY_ACC=CAM_ASM_000861 /TAXON_ID=933848 /ORGANISM="Elphidium margaritaceum" /LENGTH=190 /DNA_ID=CAMNT_0049399147 /DNA_START=812 /DNA_END=1384 /DNA_ORIENTATION=+